MRVRDAPRERVPRFSALPVVIWCARCHFVALSVCALFVSVSKSENGSEVRSPYRQISSRLTSERSNHETSIRRPGAFEVAAARARARDARRTQGRHTHARARSRARAHRRSGAPNVKSEERERFLSHPSSRKRFEKRVCARRVLRNELRNDYGNLRVVSLPIFS